MDQTEVMLTKAELLSGTEDTEEVQTCMGVFKIRSMTEGEKTRAEALVFKGLKASGGISNMENLKIEGDAERIFMNEADYDFYVIMCGLNVKGKEKWSIQEVKNIRFKGDAKSALVARIEAVSNTQNVAQKAQEFFRNIGRDGTGPDDSSSKNGAGSTTPTDAAPV